MRGTCLLIASAETEVDSMDPVGVYDGEVMLEFARGGTRMAIVSKMYDHANGFESCASKKCTSPSLYD